MAEFDSPETLLDAARAARADGYPVDAYSPFAIEGMDEALGIERSPIPAVTSPAPCSAVSSATGCSGGRRSSTGR